MGYSGPKVLATTGGGVFGALALSQSLLIAGIALLLIAAALTNHRLRRIG